MENALDQFKVTVATPEDARGIKEVSYHSWLATYPNEEAGISLEDIQDRLKDGMSEEKIAKKAEQIADASGDTKYFVIRYGDRIVAFCHVRKYPDKNQLHAIYVLPEYVGKGLGTKLWNEARNFIDPSKDTVVQAADYNKNAISFYEKLGFVDTGKRWKDDKWKMKSGACIPEMEMVLKSQESKS